MDWLMEPRMEQWMDDFKEIDIIDIPVIDIRVERMFDIQGWLDGLVDIRVEGMFDIQGWSDGLVDGATDGAVDG